MATPQREVRFMDTQRPHWSVPKFSPTQVPNNERVLRSVFSPAFAAKAETERRQEISVNTGQQKHQQQQKQPPPPPPPPPPPRPNQVARNPPPPPPPPLRKLDQNAIPGLVADQKQDFPTEVIIRSTSAYKSPGRPSSTERSASPGVDWFQTPQHVTPNRRFSQQANISDDDEDDDHDVFFSPQAPMLGNSPTSRSACESPVSRSKNSSFKTLETVDMLNYDFVQKCKSRNKLSRIIEALRAEQPEESDSPLLQAAAQRLATITQHDNPRNLATTKIDDHNSPGQGALNSLTHNISRITTGNSTIDSMHQSDNTLLMSLSPSSVLQGVDLVDTPTVQTVSKRLRAISEDNTYTKSNDRAALSEEVKRLTKEAKKLEASRIEEQQNFAMKLKKLDIAKQNAEETVNTLRGKVSKASIRAQDLIGTMQQVLMESQQTRKNFEVERKKFEKSNEQARVQEENLRLRVKELSQALQQESEQSRLKVGAERCLRVRAERDVSEKKSRLEELNKILRETRNDLEELKLQRSQFRGKLLASIGMEDSMVRADAKCIFPSISLTLSLIPGNYTYHR